MHVKHKSYEDSDDESDIQAEEIDTDTNGEDSEDQNTVLKKSLTATKNSKKRSAQAFSNTDKKEDAVVKSKRIKKSVDSLVDSKTKSSKSGTTKELNEQNVASKVIREHQVLRYNVPSPVVMDPRIRKEFEDLIVNQMRCTLLIKSLPNKTNVPEVSGMFGDELDTDVLSIRLPWDVHNKKDMGHAFVEFRTVELLQKWSSKLKTIQCRNRSVTVCKGIPKPVVKLDDYNCTRLALNSLKIHTSKQDIRNSLLALNITELNKACNTRSAEEIMIIDFPPGQEFIPSHHMPWKAYITFSSDVLCLAVLQAVLNDGFKVRGHKISVSVQKKLLPKENSTDCAVDMETRALRVFGVRKGVTEKDIRALFTRCKDVFILEGTGMACVRYDKADDCRLDHDELKTGTSKIRSHAVKIFYGDFTSTSTLKAAGRLNLANDDDNLGKKAPTKMGSEDPKTLFVKNLSRKISADVLQSVFPGAVNIKINKKKGRAECHYASADLAKVEMESAKGKKLLGNAIKVAYARLSLNSPVSGVNGESSQTGISVTNKTGAKSNDNHESKQLGETIVKKKEKKKKVNKFVKTVRTETAMDISD